MLSLVMAKSCMAYGSADEVCHYLILSAVNDIMSANREAASLTMLLYTPYIDKNSQRAADYALACVKIANGYKDMARSFDIVKANSIIISDYMKMQRRVRTTSLVIIVLLVVLVAMGAVLVYILVRRARRRKAQLDRAMGFNSRLSRTLAEITETKESIEDASARRNALTLDAYVHMSDYINDVDKFCKTTANMITEARPPRRARPCRRAVRRRSFRHFTPLSTAGTSPSTPTSYSASWRCCALRSAGASLPPPANCRLSCASTPS